MMYQYKHHKWSIKYTNSLNNNVLELCLLEIIKTAVNKALTITLRIQWNITDEKHVIDNTFNADKQENRMDFNRIGTTKIHEALYL